jgi:predicted nuclease with TOPRIM domain
MENKKYTIELPDDFDKVVAEFKGDFYKNEAKRLKEEVERYKSSYENQCKRIDGLVEEVERLKVASERRRAENEELRVALSLLHKNCLYRLGPEDYRETHVPFFIFSVVESALQSLETPKQ